jgi:hypothetical protein
MLLSGTSSNNFPTTLYDNLSTDPAANGKPDVLQNKKEAQEWIARWQVKQLKK